MAVGVNACIWDVWGLLQVVQWLLANNYLLTAFELLVEAQEAGKEASVSSLRDFFSDQNKFPVEDIAQFDQDDGRATSAASDALKTVLCIQRFI
jgi:hypothetical protein